MDVVTKKNFKSFSFLMMVSCLFSSGCTLKNPNKNLYSDSKGTSNTFLEKEDGKTIKDYDAKQVLYIANTQFLSYPSFYSEVKGDVAAGAYNQKVNSKRWKNGNEILLETISTSALVKVGDQAYFKDGVVVSRKASKVTSTKVSWSDQYIVENDAEYKKKYGELPSLLSHYIFNDTTIKQARFIKEDIEKDEYTYEYVLDNYKATPKYQIKMKTNGELTDYPTFTKIVLVFTFDSLMNIKQLDVDEDYSMNKKVLGSNLHLKCNGQMTETFSLNDKVEIPNLEFFKQAYENEKK